MTGTLIYIYKKTNKHTNKQTNKKKTPTNERRNIKINVVRRFDVSKIIIKNEENA